MASARAVQIVTPIFVRNRAVSDAAAARQHLKALKCCFRREHFIVIAKKRADDIRHDAFAAGAHDHVFDLHAEQVRESSPQS